MRVLAFLESLCGALSARDLETVRRLLAHPLAQALPRAVRDEARGIASGNARGYAAPLQTMHLYHQTAHLLGACSDTATRRTAPSPAERSGGSQIELPLERVSAY